jgi:hypothetical protein
VSVVEAADTVTLENGYGELAKEAKALAPDYQARSVCTDGWEATRQAWRGLFPKIKLVLCFLHSILKIKKHCAGQLRHQGLDKAWQVYQAATKRQFSQRLRRVAEWAPAHLSGAVAQMVLKMCRRRADFTPAYDCPQASRTSNAVDRLLDYQDRLLYTGAIGTGLPTARVWPYGPWRCNGTFTRMAPACGVTSRRGRLPFTTSTACSITQTGCITS